MKIVIKTKNLKLNLALRQYIREKINSLEKFAKVFQNKEKYFFRGRNARRFRGVKRPILGKPKVEAWLEIGKTTLHHQKGPIFRAECQMRFPGKSLRSTARSKNLRLAITEVKDELQRGLKQYKQKVTSLTKRRARILKKSLRLAPGAKFKRKKGARIREEGS